MSSHVVSLRRVSSLYKALSEGSEQCDGGVEGLPTYIFREYSKSGGRFSSRKTERMNRNRKGMEQKRKEEPSRRVNAA